MRIAICGHYDEAIKDAVQHYFAYRGKACYSYNYLAPIEMYMEVINIISRNEEITGSVEGDQKLRDTLLEVFGPCLEGLCNKAIKENTGRWQELMMDHITLVWNILDDDKSRRPFYPFRVLLRSPKKSKVEESHLPEIGFNDCAVGFIFDVVVDTDEHSPEEVANLIGAKLHDKMKTAMERIDAVEEAL